MTESRPHMHKYKKLKTNFYSRRMGQLFFDIETYASENNINSGLNPYYPESKVLVISYNYYDGFCPPTNEKIKEPTFLKVWEYTGEKEMLYDFFQTLKKLQQEDAHLKYYGFNILKIDLSYLFGRMKINNIADNRELYDILFRQQLAFDMYQLSSVISDECRKHKQLWGMNQKEVSKFFKLQVKEGMGVQCSRYYDKKDYESIMEYCKEEFNLEQMLNAFYMHLVKKKERAKQESWHDYI